MDTFENFSFIYQKPDALRVIPSTQKNKKKVAATVNFQRNEMPILSSNHVGPTIPTLVAINLN